MVVWGGGQGMLSQIYKDAKMWRVFQPMKRFRYGHSRANVPVKLGNANDSLSNGAWPGIGGLMVKKRPQILRRKWNSPWHFYKKLRICERFFYIHNSIIWNQLKRFSTSKLFFFDLHVCVNGIHTRQDAPQRHVWKSVGWEKMCSFLWDLKGAEWWCSRILFYIYTI